MQTQTFRLLLTTILLGLTSLIQAQATPSSQPQFPEASAFSKSTFSYKIINSPNNTFGYDIFADGRLLIHQPSVPGMPGNEGFKSKESAQNVAQLVITKIKKGEMPPTVTKEELQKLKAIK